jgi:hypothetical protein
MALKMTNREVDGVAILSLEGRIVLGEETNALREKVKDLIAGGKKKVVLNMNDVTLIDSSGFGRPGVRTRTDYLAVQSGSSGARCLEMVELHFC